MKPVTASREDLLVLVDEQGQVRAHPSDRMTEVVKILTTPAKVRHSEFTGTGISDQVRTLQPGEEGHAAASLEAAGFDVVEA